MRYLIITVVLLLTSCSTGPKKPSSDYLDGCLTGSSFFVQEVIRRPLQDNELDTLKTVCTQLYYRQSLKKSGY